VVPGLPEAAGLQALVIAGRGSVNFLPCHVREGKSGIMVLAETGTGESSIPARQKSVYALLSADSSFRKSLAMKRLVLLLCFLAPMTLLAQTPLHPQVSILNNQCPQPNSYCKYVWDRVSGCCVPSVASNGYCPALCGD
jgi:hypothetical protein